MASAVAVMAAVWTLESVPMAGAAEFVAGVAVADITPPVGYRMSGYFYERLSTGALNPLHAKALILKDGPQRAALVFCDLIGITREVSAQARKQASEKTGIPDANILIAATHTHTGPLYAGAMRKFLHDRAVAKSGSDPQETIDYPAKLIAAIVQAVAQADADAKPAILTAGTAEQLGLAFNRRFHMKDGSVRFNPGPLNPDIVRPAGPIDPQMGIILVRDAAGARPAAAVANFALHLDTTGGTLYAADYPYYIEQTLRECLGERFTLLFATGPCGDVNHVDITKKARPKSALLGRTIAATVRERIDGLKPIAAPALAVRSETLEVPLQTHTPEQLAKAREDIAKVGLRQIPFLQEVAAYKVLGLEQRGGRTMPLEVQVFRLSHDVAVVCLPGEVFVELGLAVKRASPFATTLVVELSNDCPEYVPTRKAFAEGSYETVNSQIAPGGGEMLVETAVRLLKSLAM
ncbi:MAG: neutral/alkaline non-lysosomal ceramidase N-terminal domain-containing protein [Planctomycetota bacterium]|nr:neutral/alkaline non-lysosomal ceramidase N-terminal domain-containing protein [Planctomycetota bacterium]